MNVKEKKKTSHDRQIEVKFK